MATVGRESLRLGSWDSTGVLRLVTGEGPVASPSLARGEFPLSLSSLWASPRHLLTEEENDCTRYVCSPKGKPRAASKANGFKEVKKTPSAQGCISRYTHGQRTREDPPPASRLCSTWNQPEACRACGGHQGQSSLLLASGSYAQCPSL